MNKIFFALMTFFILMFYTSEISANISQNQYINEFSSDLRWIKLLHYHPILGGGNEGLVENEAFYVSPTGRQSPEDEMQAEIEAFRKGKIKCRFPARFNLLKEWRLVSGTLDECDEYRQFMEDVRPQGITVLFTNAYMSNPASLFGHTLLRIDTNRKGTQMLAHGSNFGADSGTEYGFLFALKGLFGGYQGVYSISPYWEIINTYNNIENRDIWEYKLNLSDEEVLTFVNHLYEMRNAKIRYYFLSKNCSYMILELLEAVRPNLVLTSQYDAWVIPLDTMKTISEMPQLVGEINYRPARFTRIKHRIGEMSAAQQRALKKAVKEQQYDMPDLTPEEQADVLETAYQYYQYQYVDKNMDLAEYRRNSFAVLRKRADMPKVRLQSDFDGENPVLSHDSMMVSMHFGSDKHRTFEQLELRPAYTVLTDNSYGLVKGAEVKVFDSVWRYYNRSHKLVLQSLTPLQIKSLVPADSLFSPISYATDISVRRKYELKSGTETYVAAAAFGLGRTYELYPYIWLYGLMKLNGEYGGSFNGNQWFGIAPEIGILNNFGALRWHNVLEQVWATRHEGTQLQYHSKLSFGWNVHYNFEVEYTRRQDRSSRTQEVFSAGISYAF